MLLELGIPEHNSKALAFTKRAAELREHLKRKKREEKLAKTPAQVFIYFFRFIHQNEDDFFIFVNF